MITHVAVFFGFAALGFFSWSFQMENEEKGGSAPVLPPVGIVDPPLIVPSVEAVPTIDVDQLLKGPLLGIKSLVQDLPHDLLAKAGPDLEAFVPDILTMPGGEALETHLAVLVMKRVLSEDPERGFEHLSLVRRINYEKYIQCLFEVWLKIDRTAAIKAAQSVHRGDEVVIDLLYAEEPEVAFRILKRNEKSQQAAQVFQSWTAKDPDAAFAALLSISHQRLFEEALAAFASVIGSEDPEKGIELTSFLKGAEEGLALRAIYRAWFKNQFTAPLDSLEAIENLTLKNHLIVSSIEPIAQANPQRAWELIRQNLKGADFELAMSDMVGHLDYEEHGAWIREIVDELPLGSAREQLVRHVAIKWGEVDPVATLSWLAGMGELPTQLQEVSKQLIEREGEDKLGLFNWAPFVEAFGASKEK